MANTMLGLSEVRRGDEPMDATPRDHIWPQWMVNGATGEKKILAGPTDGWMTKDEYRMATLEQAAKSIANKRIKPKA